MKKNYENIFLVPGDPLGPSRVPSLAPNRGIFSKVNGTGPLGSGGHPHTIFSNGRFYWRQSCFGGDVTPDANLDCTFVENALVFVALKIERARAPPVRPPLA